MAGSQPAKTGEMSSMMDGMMGGEGEHGGDRRSPFFTRLMAYPDLAPAERQNVARQADQRIQDGLSLIDAGHAAAMHASTPQARLEAVRQLREGLDILAGAAAAQAALQGEQDPSVTAQNWFRDQLSLAVPSEHQPNKWLGVTPSHFLLMMFLALVSAALLVLQALRLHRVRKIVAATRQNAASVPHPSNGDTGKAEVAPIAVGAQGAPSASELSVVAADLQKPSRRFSGELRVAQIVRETPTVRTFRLVAPGADRLPFDFLPGQFLQVEVQAEDRKAARRSYTIASSPSQRAYVELTVKREEQGAVSRFLHDRVTVGDMLKVSGPFGDFTFTGTDADSVVLIAGGVGITPMMSVLRYLTDIAWPGQIFFVYGARSTDEFVFRDELERLERRFDNLHVMASMQRSAGTVWLGAEGPITQEMLRTAVPDIPSRRVHLCGPPGMMEAMRRQLAELGVPEAQIHTEAFAPASIPADAAELKVEPAMPPSSRQASASTMIAPTTVTFAISGISAALPADETVLEAAEEAGVEIPYACRVGKCGVCATKLLSGEVSMEVETGLAPEDKANGYILACQARSTGQPLVVEA